ncbi:MAG: PDZ domain-containing protein [Chitinivibrionales bacterium]|nr:PDZ domain-containing protein [Chitinivibrionales bacterium]
MSTQTKKHPLGKTPLLGIVMLVVVITGLMADKVRPDAEDDNFYADIIRLDNVTTKIHQNYVEEVSSKDLVDKAIEGMIEILDPHTSYFEKKQFEELRIHTEGKFGGLGIQISIRENVLTVMTPIGGTPASRAGIRSGDQIIKIEGKSTKGIKLDEAVGKLRGKPGTEVSITVRRKGETKPLHFTITREIIKIKSVPFSGVFDDSIGYIRLNTFSQEAGDEIEKSVKTLVKKGINGLVLDLRFNPGGLLPQAIEVSSKFLPKKSLVVSTRGRAPGQNKEFYVKTSPVFPENMPLVVLVNPASASASEIVAGAIQDWDRGIVLGDTTFGKGSVQSILYLDKTHHIKLTTAFYYTPSGRCINKPENDVRGNGDAQDDQENIDTASLGSQATSVEAADTVQDTSAYRTKNGRIVLGGGGIIPDTIVEPESFDDIVRALFGRDAFFKFANLQHPMLKKAKAPIDTGFSINDKLYASFRAFLDSIDFEYKTMADIAFDDFKQHAGLEIEKPDTADTIDNEPAIVLTQQEKQELESISRGIERLLAQERKREFAEVEQEVRKYIREAFLVREYGQDNELVYRTKLADDVQLKAALELLSDKNLYASILKPKK